MTLRTNNLVKSYRGRRVVDEVNLSVEPGKVVGLLGPNGAGKTTSFYMVVGLVHPEQGEVFFGEQEITNLPMHERARLGIGYLPQEQSVFRKLTVEENILLLFEILEKFPKSEFEGRLAGLLKELGIEHLRHRHCYELSGGEVRRVEIARALAPEPKFLLLDEPFTGIDPITITDLQGIIRFLKDKGIGILITDHNVRETLAITDHAYIIFGGKILIKGNSDEILNDPEARRLYLGEQFVL